MPEIGAGGINPFSKVELKDPTKKAEFDAKVQTALSDGVLTKEEFSKLKEDFVAKDGPGLDKLIGELPTDQEVTASLAAIPNDSNKALEPLRQRYDKVLPDLAKMLGVDVPQQPANLKDSGLFVHVEPDLAPPLQPMEVNDPSINLNIPPVKKQENLKDTGMFVHIEPDKAPPLQLMEENDPTLNLDLTKKPVSLRDSGMFVHIEPDKAPPLQLMEVVDTPPLNQEPIKKPVSLKDSGMFVHVEPDKAPPLQLMPEVDDPFIKLDLNKKP
jgi:hypothetical protein